MSDAQTYEKLDHLAAQLRAADAKVFAMERQIARERRAHAQEVQRLHIRIRELGGDVPCAG